MSEKKRTTVTTIETHEVWIIRKAPETADETVLLMPTEITLLPEVSTSSELKNSSETNEEEEP